MFGRVCIVKVTVGTKLFGITTGKMNPSFLFSFFWDSPISRVCVYSC